MARQGRNLENLVRTLEQTLSKKNTSILSPGYVEDRVTG